jgi:predicted metalloprotease
VRRFLALLLLFTTLVAFTACSESEVSIGTGSGSDVDDDDQGDEDEEEIDLDEEIRPEDPEELEDSDLPDPSEVVQAALHDVEDFWSRSYRGVYESRYDEISGGFHAYGPDTQLPPCGEPLDYEMVAGNAFYCPIGDYIAWDEVNLIPGLQEQFGPFTVAIVMAHEFGHAIQARAEIQMPTVFLEMQADCFAGAWVADVAEGNAQYFAVSGDELDASLAGFITIRDFVGSSAEAADAHGSGFDRVTSFQDGFEQGAAACAEYEIEPPTVVQFPFEPGSEDEANEGNLPLDELAPLLVANLDAFFADLFLELGQEWDPVDDVVAVDEDESVECGGEEYDAEDLAFASFYCIDDDTVYVDNVNLVPELDGIGDFAFAAEITRNYAVAAEVQLGLDTETEEAAYAQDCLTGAFSGAMFNGEITPEDPDPSTPELNENGLSLSPGDLDEVIIAILTFASQAEVEGTAFERTNAVRAGFFSGAASCIE